MKITAIIPHKKKPGVDRIFIDGRFSFSIPAELVRKEDLKQGVSLSPAGFNKLKIQQKYCDALDYARLLLSYRRRSQKEIAERLKSKGYSKATAARVIEKLKEERQVNDGDFARWWIQNRRQSRPKGDFAIANELRQKGVEGEVIERAFREIEREDPVDKTDLAFRSCRGMLERYRSLDRNTARRRLRAFLKRRGFSFDTIRETEEKFFRGE